ncbi:MAG: adenosylcobinamide-GDP ribazoletransferase [Anaerolineales bacterium]|nr:adenosylcobinamide-GDP ribazoletransferase [Anaerolineales bacterium]
MRNLKIAFGLMTTLPFRLPDDWQTGDSGRASIWYPFVGLVIGGLTWLIWTGTMRIFPAPVAGILTLIVWVSLTGGLHLDGLADCCDGLLASASVERRLEIMKDPRLGAFGGIGLILNLLLKAAILSALTPETSLGIILAASLARWCILPAGLLPLARPSGMGADFAAGFRRRFIFVGAIFPLGLALALGTRGVVSLLAGLVAAALVLRLAKSRIGGVTGDVFGMTVEVVETVSLLAFVIGKW